MNPLAIRIAADLAQFKANMAEMRVQLETNQAAMKRMTSAFDGNKIIGDANAMVIAISKIGGASKLTEAEQRRVNATVTEAIAKYNALGRSAPTDLYAIRDATKHVGDSSTSLTGKLKGVAGALGLAFGSAAVIAGVKSLVSSTLDYAESIKNTAAKMDVSMQATQRWQFAAQQTGASLDNVSASVLKLSQGLVGGDKGLEQALKAVGLSASAIRNMKPEDAFNAMTAAIAKIQDPMLQAKVTMEAFGKSGLELLPAIRDGFVAVAAGAKTMSDETIRRLDEAKTAWQNFGRTVTIVTGEMISDTAAGFQDVTVIIQNFGRIFNEALKNGPGAALRLTGELGRFKDAIHELTDAQKKQVDQLLKNGIPANQVYDTSLGKNEASVLAYIASLNKTTQPLKQFGDGNNEAAREAQRLAEAFQKQVDVLTGKALAREVATLAKQVEVAGKQGGLTAYEYEQLGKRLADMHFRGATLPNILHDIWLSHERLNPSIKVTTDAYKILNDTMKMTKTIGLMPPPPLPLPVSLGPIDLSKLGVQLGALKPPPEIKTFGDKLAASIAKSLEGLGGIIVGAIQGGGDVARAAFAHVGSSLGADLGKWIEKGLGGSLGKILGGFAGPLGALLGSGLGGLVDKIFGKNQGREDAKGFAAGFGGFDALREQMLKLGAEGDRLWIALTQNTKGPEQVAATIRLIEEALRKAEEQAGKTGDTLKDTFEGPEGARGFPTREQLQKAAADAEETWRYIKDSGKYNAAQVEQAWEQWQDALVAAGDTSIQKVRELDKEIKSLQDAIAMEPPEFDAEGNRMYGVEEWNNIQKLQAAEAERAKLTQAQIKEEMDAREAAAEFATGLVATQIDDEQKLRQDALKDIAAMTGVEMAEQVKAGEMAAQAASKTAAKEFDTAKTRAKDLDAYLTKLFTGGYEIPITFKLPNGVPGGQPSTPAPWFGGSTSGVSSAPSVIKGSGAPILLTVVTTLDGKVVAQNQAKHLPAELEFIGARR